MIKKIFMTSLMVLCFGGMAFADSYTVSDINSNPVSNTTTVIIGATTYEANAFSITAVGSSVTSTMTANEELVPTTPTSVLVNTISAFNTGDITVTASLEDDSNTVDTSSFATNTYAVQAVGASMNSTVVDSDTGDDITYSLSATNEGTVVLVSTIDVGVAGLSLNTDISSLAIGSSTTADFTWNP